MLIPNWLSRTMEQENQESREETGEPATPPPCPEGRTVTPQFSPSTPNTRDDSSARATDQAGDRHDTCGTRLTCDTCGRRDGSHARDTSVTRDTRDACDTSRACDSCDTSGTSFPCAARSARDISGKVPGGTHRPPDVPDEGSSTLVGQPENMSTVAPSGLTQRKEEVSGRIWRYIFKHLCCGLPRKRGKNNEPRNTQWMTCQAPWDLGMFPSG